MKTIERGWAVVQLLAAVVGGCVTVTVVFADRPAAPPTRVVVAPTPPPAPCPEPPRSPLYGCGVRR